MNETETDLRIDPVTIDANIMEAVNFTTAENERNQSTTVELPQKKRKLESVQNINTKKAKCKDEL